VHGHEKDAVLMYRESIMIQTQLYGTEHISVANLLHNLGNCFRELADFEKSFDCLSRSLSLLRMFFEDENEEVADTCHCLALTLVKKCELDEASLLFERALTIRKKKLGALDLNVASSAYNLALIHQMKGAWGTAMKHCAEALRIQKLTLGDNNDITASTLECIGHIHMDKGEFEDSIQCFRRCISQKPKLQRECGIIYRSRGELFKAENMFINASLYAVHQLGISVSRSTDLDLLQLSAKLQELKADTSEGHSLGFAENVMYYGSVLMNIEKFREALECFRFSNDIFQSKFGSDHLTIAENLHCTSFILEKLSDSMNNRQGLEEALELSTEALRIRKLHLVLSHPDLEETLLCLGRTHYKLGNFVDALHFLTDAVKARNNRLGSMSPRMDDADTLIQVGQLQQQSGKFRQALDSFEQSLSIRRQILGSEHPSIGELLLYVGNLLREVGDLDAAQLKFEQSLAIAEQADPDSIETADVLFSLGVLSTEQKQYSAAITAYLGSLQVHKARGSTNTVIAEILNNIGIAYFEMRELDKAQVYHAEALEALRQELGDEHADVAFCWHSLGAVHQELCNQDEALKCFENAVQIDRSEMYLQSLGICLVTMNQDEKAFVCLDEALRMKAVECDNDANDDLAEIQRHLGFIWLRKQRFAEALKCFEEALKVKIPHCGDSEKDHAHLINCLDGALEAVSELFGARHVKYARLLHKKGDLHGAKNEHSLAIAAYVEVLRVYKGQHGDSHLSVANTLFNLGVSLNAKGSPDKAIRCFMKALRISKEKLGEDHLDVADTYERIAESNKLLLRNDDAKIYYEKSLYVRKQTTGGGDIKSAAIMQQLGQLHLLEGLLDDAERAFKEVVRIETMQLGEDHVVAESMYNLGLLYISRKDVVKALKYLEGSLRIRKTKLTNTDIQLAHTFHSLGGVHNSMGSVDKSVFCYDKAMQIYIKVYGKNHDLVGSSLAGKGESLHSGKHYREALSCFSECLDIRKVIDGPTPSKESGDAHWKMANLYLEVGDNASATSSFASALSTYRQIYGTQHKTVAHVLQKMADHFVKVGEFERGYSCVKEALALRQVLLGEDDIRTGDSHYCKGKISFMWNDYAEASLCFERARDIYKRLGPLSINVANANFYLGCISGESGR
jgi:tetratricopeptide (TPR) repeat protein